MEQNKNACMCLKCKQVFNRSDSVDKYEKHYGVDRLIKLSPCCDFKYRSVEIPLWTLRWIMDKQEDYWEDRKKENR